MKYSVTTYMTITLKQSDVVNDNNPNSNTDAEAVWSIVTTYLALLLRQTGVVSDSIPDNDVEAEWIE